MRACKISICPGTRTCTNLSKAFRTIIITSTDTTDIMLTIITHLPNVLHLKSLLDEDPMTSTTMGDTETLWIKEIISKSPVLRAHTGSMRKNASETEKGNANATDASLTKRQ